MSRLAGDNQISESTTCGYPHDGIDVLAAGSPSLHGAPLAAALGLLHFDHART